MDRSTSPEITLSEEAGIRYLHFGSPWIQGAMRIRRPWDIVIDYVALMQSWLLFLEPPKRILQIGLGAAALTKHSYRFFPGAELFVVEASVAVVLAARQYFCLPEDDARLTTVVQDGADYLKNDLHAMASLRGAKKAARSYGVIQVDVYDQDARGPVLESLEFYQQCHRALGDTGILSVNLFGEADSFTRNLSRIRQAFDNRVLVWPAVDAGNVVVLGFKGPSLAVAWTDLAARARQLDQAYELPAEKWLRNLRRHPTQGRASTADLRL